MERQRNCARPTTASSSACARHCTSGKATTASAHHFSVVEVVSKPTALRRVVILTSSPRLKENRSYYVVPERYTRKSGSDCVVRSTMRWNLDVPEVGRRRVEVVVLVYH